MTAQAQRSGRATGDGHVDGVGRSQSIATVERAMDVLLLFGRSPESSLGVTEIAGTLSMSKAAVHRVLTSLRSRELVHVDASTRRYSLGPAALGLGRAYLDRLDIRTIAGPELAQLSEQTNETATLSIRNGDVRMYVDQVVPRREVKMTVALGVPYPLNAGGSSKAFLAFLGDEAIDMYLSNRTLESLTPNTIVDPVRMRRELAAIRKRGYSTSVNERLLGAASIAAPVRDFDGRPVAVVSVCGPAERFQDQAEICAEHLLVVTGRLSSLMGYKPDR